MDKDISKESKADHILKDNVKEISTTKKDKKLDLNSPKKKKEENVNSAKQEIEDEDEEEEVNSIGNVALIRSITMMLSFVVLFFCEFPNEPLYMMNRSFDTNFLVPENGNKLKLSIVKNFEDLQNFFTKMLLPKIYKASQNVLEPKIDDYEKQTRYHFVNEYNYFCGMRLTIRQANFVKNEDYISEKVLPLIRADDYSSAKGDIKEEIKTTKGDFEYSTENTYKKSGGFGIFFEGNMTLIEATKLWNKIVSADLINVNKTISFVSELLLYNANYRVALYMSFVAIMKNTGSLDISSSTNGFYPQNYENFVSNSEITLFVIFQVIFQLLAFWLLIEILLKGLLLLFDLYYGVRIIISSLFLMDIVMTAFSMTSIFLYYILNFSRSQHFSIPMDKTQFQFWVEYSSTFESYYVVNAILVIFLCSRNILILTKKFPVFGVLFQTIQKSSWDLLHYLLLLFSLAITFSFIAFFLFGTQNETLSSLYKSIFEFFKNFVGCKTYESIFSSTKTASSLFIICFNIVMIIIILKLLTAILLASYGKIRKTRQLHTEANARIVEEEGTKKTKLFLDLICCVAPGANNPEKSQDNSDNSSPYNVDKYLNKKKEEEECKNTRLSIWEICKINLFRLFKSEALTFEQVKDKRQKKIDELQKEQYEQEEQEKKNQEKNIIYSIWNFFLFLIFLIVYTTMIFTQIPIGNFFDANQSMGELLKNVANATGVSSFHCIDQLYSLYYILDQAMFSDRNNQKLTTEALVFLNPIIRISVQKVKLFPNEDERTANLIPVRRKNSPSEKKDLKSSFLGCMNSTSISLEEENTLYSFYGSGSARTYQKKGGIVFYFPMTPSKAQIQFSHLFLAGDYQLKQISIEILSYSKNRGIFVKSDLIAEYFDSGELKVNYYNKSFQIRQYSGSLIWRSIAEIIVFILCFYFNYGTIYDYLLTWEKIREEDNKDQLKAETDSTTMERVLIFLNIDPRKNKNKGICELLIIIIFNGFKLLLIWIRRIFLGLFYFIFSDFGMLLQVCWLVLMDIQIFAWIRVISFRSSLPFMKEEDSEVDYFGHLSEMSEIEENYIFFSAWASLFTYLCFIRFLYFFPKMTILFKVLSRVKVNLLFFLILFFILLLGFTIAGMMLFGTNTASYKGFVISFLSTFKITVKYSNFNEMNDSNPTLTPLYFIVFNFVFYFFMIRILVVLIVIIYEETSNNHEKKAKSTHQKTISEMISNELNRKFDEIYNKFQDEEQMKHEDKVKQAYQSMPIIYKIASFLTRQKYRQKQVRAIQADNIEKNFNEENKEENKSSSVKLNSFLQEYKNIKAQSKSRNPSQEITFLDKASEHTWISILEIKLLKSSEGRVHFSKMALNNLCRHLNIKYYPKHYNICEDSDPSFSEIDSDSQFGSNEKTVKEIYEHWEYKDALQKFNQVSEEEEDKQINVLLLGAISEEITSQRGMLVADSPISLDLFFNSAEYCSHYSRACSKKSTKILE